MNQTTEKMIEVQERLLTDPNYLERNREYLECNAAFVRVLGELTPEQRRIVEDYLGICVELHTRMLQIACER